MQNSIESMSKEFVDIMTMDNNTNETIVEENCNEDEKLDFPDLDPEMKSPEVDYEAIGEFCFESDTLALKGNNDYKNVLEAIVILEAQKEQATKDLAILLELKEKALADPMEFVEKLKKKEDLQIPTPQRIYPVPSIDWGKYALSGDPSVFRKRQLFKIAADVKKRFKRKLKSLPELEMNEEEEYWSSMEEKQLEQLLLVYNAEVEPSVRWQKVADCLENRTPSQVEAKAKKSFPLLSSKVSEQNPHNVTALRRITRSNSQLKSETNGFQGSPNVDEDSMDSKNEVSDDDEIDPELYDTAEYQELLLYKKLLRKRIKSSTMTQHFGFRCAWCKSEPIVGTRYHCIECNPTNIDFCEDCVNGGYEIDQHSADHKIEEIQHSTSGFLDRDYMHFLGNDYNYLDPNYMPAT